MASDAKTDGWRYVMPLTSRPSRTFVVDAGQRRERRVALEALAGSLAVHRLEVVEAPHAVEAGLVGELRPVDDLREGHPLLGDVESEPHGPNVRRSRLDSPAPNAAG